MNATAASKWLAMRSVSRSEGTRVDVGRTHVGKEDAGRLGRSLSNRADHVQPGPVGQVVLGHDAGDRLGFEERRGVGDGVSCHRVEVRVVFESVGEFADLVFGIDAENCVCYHPNTSWLRLL